MIKYLSEKIARYIAQNDETADFEVLAYGYELLIQEVCVTLITLILALPFGLFFPVLISILSYNFVRRDAGGMHAKYRIACIATSVFVMYGPAFYFSKVGHPLSLMAIVVLYAVDILFLFLYAPADTTIRPVQDPIKRKQHKKKALIKLSICFVVALMIRGWRPDYASVLVTCVTFVCLLTHPLAYKLYGCQRSNIMLEVLE